MTTAAVSEEVAPREDAAPPVGTPGAVDLEFRPDVEGLRAVAIILVVLYHSGVCTGGYVGVDVFFVISGFLITGLLIREHEHRSRVSLPGFYARRARRILPAATLVIIAVIVWAHQVQNVIAYGYGPSNTVTDGKWAALFAANIHFANVSENYFAQGSSPSPLLHYWSLAVEEQFYFVWPTLVLLVGLAARWISIRVIVFFTAAAAVAASFVWAVHVGAVNSIWSFYSPFTRAWELGVGALAATAVSVWGRLNQWAGVVLAFAGLTAILVVAATYDSVYATAWQLAVPVLGAAAIVIGGTSGLGAGWLLGCAATPGEGAWSRGWARFQRANPMRAVGRVSYGWYLLHYPPMILLAGILWTGPLPVHERLEISAVTLVVAFGMYYALERPIRRNRWLAARPWMSILMGIALVTAAFLVCDLLHKTLAY